jgi:hypothetical protein
VKFGRKLLRSSDRLFPLESEHGVGGVGDGRRQTGATVFLDDKWYFLLNWSALWRKSEGRWRASPPDRDNLSVLN